MQFLYFTYVLALANIFIRAEARHFAGYKPAPRVDDKLHIKIPNFVACY